MGEENRASSGGSTATIVVVILGVLLLIGCSCGGIIVGVSLFVYSRAASEEEMEREFRDRELKDMGERIRQDMEAIKIPLAPPLVPAPQTAPDPEAE
jgi:hypothetical protein